MTVVICALGGEHGPFELPSSHFSARSDITGGERSLYELGFAAAAVGHAVELRGDISRQMFEELAREIPGPSPSVGFAARRPTADDLVVVPEALEVPTYPGPALSGARAVMMILAPVGLFGPALHPGWTQSDLLSVPVESVAQPDLFHAIAAAGFELWTNSPGTASAAHDAGLECTYLGTGSPLPPPCPVPRTYDVAFVEANRWRALAESVAAQLDASCLRIGPQVGWNGVAAELAKARILIWPSRIEGNSRIQREARTVGTVPVALPSRFTPDLNERSGAVVVESLEQMPAVIEALLRDPLHLRELSRRAVEWARTQLDWQAYIARVDEAIKRPSPDRVWRFRQLAGAALDDVLDRAHVLDLELRQSQAELADLRSRTQQLEGDVERLRIRAAELNRPRHRLADRANDLLRSLPPLHRAAKSILVPALREDKIQT